jgi:hypothetical protein
MQESRTDIVIVSGLPRSGTSMMMQMLESSGLEVLSDQVRKPDEDNLRGYYELEKVKKLKEHATWLSDASGKVVKVISQLLQYLPSDHTYKTIFLQRDLGEVLASQHQMLIRRNVDVSTQVSDDRLAGVFERHLQETYSWLNAQANISTLYMDYADILQDPGGNSARANHFLGGTLDEALMAGAIDRTLHRQKH